MDVLTVTKAQLILEALLSIQAEAFQNRLLTLGQGLQLLAIKGKGKL
jgi:hypothetical protein